MNTWRVCVLSSYAQWQKGDSVCVLTDLVCSGRGAITGGGSASSSSSSSDTVAMAGVSDTALELCVMSQGERGRSLSDIMVTWATNDTRPIIASWISCHFLYCFTVSSYRGVLRPVFSSPSSLISASRSVFPPCFPSSHHHCCLKAQVTSGFWRHYMPHILPFYPSLPLCLSLIVWRSAGGQAAETGKRWKEEKMLIHNAERGREREREEEECHHPPPSVSYSHLYIWV